MTRSLLRPAVTTRHSNRSKGRAPPLSTGRHYDVLSWNAGGLGGGLYDELLLYIKQSSHDIVIVQETINGGLSPLGKTNIIITSFILVLKPRITAMLEFSLS